MNERMNALMLADPARAAKVAKQAALALHPQGEIAKHWAKVWLDVHGPIKGRVHRHERKAHGKREGEAPRG